MKLVRIEGASRIADETSARWLEQCHGSGVNLEKRFGPAESGEFLPGLGDLVGWGLQGEADGIMLSGAILTGFIPQPKSVSVLLTACATGDRLSLSSLEGLLDLPEGSLETFTLRSWVGNRRVWRVSNQGKTVIETTSRRAAVLCERLVTHLVRDPAVACSEIMSLETPPRLFVRTVDSGVVSDFGMHPSLFPDSRFRPLLDWEG